jgi:hypothetical protein
LSWARLDDRANENRKQLAAGPEACWLWSCALMYANRQPQRDGFLPTAVIGMLYPFKAPQKLAAKLVEVGLWEEAPGGYQIHDYLFWNKTKDQVNHEKAEARRRAAESYARKTGKSAPLSASLSAPAEQTQKQNSAGVAVASGLVSGSDPEATTDQVDPSRDVAALARQIIKNPYDGEYSQPSKWPEVREIAASWGFGAALRLGNSPKSDSDLRAILEALAAENPVSELLRAGEIARRDPYFADPKRRHPATFTLAVVRRLLSQSHATTPPEEPADLRAIRIANQGAEA